MFAQHQTGVPLWTAAGWFISNSSEALIGAYCITRFDVSGKRLEGVRGIFVFVLFGVLFAPLATSFLDAAAVIFTGWGGNYLPLSMERFWTNALAELTIVPILVLCGSGGISAIRRVSVALWGEATVLSIGIVLVAALAFGLEDGSPATTPALLYLPLPLLLWAAVRFGLGGCSLSLLSVALISTWYTIHGREPFPHASLPQNILSLQILFCVVGVPLMFLSAVMAETRRTQELLRRVSGSLIQAQEQERHRIARELHDGLGQELAFVKVTLDTLIEKSGASLKSQLTRVSNQVSAIADSTHELSHALYPTTLEYLGLQKALKILCDEAQQGKDLSIRLTIENLPEELDRLTSLSLYRIAQESLHNIIRHSQAKNVEIDLASDQRRISLHIIDDGVGFDVRHESAGLGLASMRERVRAIGGWIDISSSPKAGMRMDIQVPLREHRSEDAAGVSY
jgi:signal transduction histidine kinase